MSNRVIFGSDYDGTYRRRGDFPDPSDVDAVREFRKRGNLFGVVTGRNIYEAIGITPTLQDEFDFLMCSSGAVCILPDKTFLFRDDSSAQRMIELYDLCCELGCWHIHFDITGCIHENVDLVDGSGADKLTLKKIRDTNPEITEEDKKKDEIKCTVMEWGPESGFVRCALGREYLGMFDSFTQFSVGFGSTDEAQRAAGKIHSVLGEIYECHVAGAILDITKAGINKAAGLAKYAKLIGVPECNIYAAGDGRNDIDMLSTYNGIAIEGSDDAVVRSALTTASNIAEALSIAESGNLRRR